MSLASRPLWQVCFVCGATIELFLQCWANNMLRNQIFVAVLGWFQPINHDLSLCLTESPLFCSFSHENRLFLWDKTLGINIFCDRIESRIRSSENLSQWNHWDLVHDLFLTQIVHVRQRQLSLSSLPTTHRWAQTRDHQINLIFSYDLRITHCN